MELLSCWSLATMHIILCIEIVKRLPSTTSSFAWRYCHRSKMGGKRDSDYKLFVCIGVGHFVFVMCIHVMWPNRLCLILHTVKLDFNALASAKVDVCTYVTAYSDHGVTLGTQHVSVQWEEKHALWLEMNMSLLACDFIFKANIKKS